MLASSRAGRHLNSPGDHSMATATRDQGKTRFVKEFLSDHPLGNLQAVNEAWAAAGKDGSIGATLIQKMRSQMGLTGNLRGNSKTAAKGKAASNMPTTATATPGKTSFVKNFLNANPQGTTKTVNEAWQAAGFDGTISHPIISQVRKQLGLTGNLRGKTKKSESTAQEKAPYTGKKLGRPRKETTVAGNGLPRGRRSNRSLALNELEADIDRLIFKVMGVGDLTEIETVLREARRRVYKALTS